MTTPTSNQSESNKMRKFTSTSVDDSIRDKLPLARDNGGNSSPMQNLPISDEPQPVAAPNSPVPKRRRLNFLPALWTIASVLSLTVNIILIIILLLDSL